jgi:hypothetical protein
LQIYRQENVEKEIAFGLKHAIVGSTVCQRIMGRLTGMRFRRAELDGASYTSIELFCAGDAREARLAAFFFAAS